MLVSLFVPRRERNYHGGQQDCPSDLYSNVYIHKHLGLQVDSVR